MKELQNEIDSCHAKFSAINFALKNASSPEQKKKLRAEMEAVREYENYLYSCQNENPLSNI